MLMYVGKNELNIGIVYRCVNVDKKIVTIV